MEGSSNPEGLCAWKDRDYINKDKTDLVLEKSGKD